MEKLVNLRQAERLSRVEQVCACAAIKILFGHFLTAFCRQYYWNSPGLVLEQGPVALLVEDAVPAVQASDRVLVRLVILAAVCQTHS